MKDPERIESAALMILARYVAVFAAAFLMSAFADWIALQFVGKLSFWIDDIVIGICAVVLYGAYRRHEAARREVNQYVRNAMNVVLTSPDKQAVEEARKMIDDALRTWL